MTIFIGASSVAIGPALAGWALASFFQPSMGGSTMKDRNERMGPLTLAETTLLQVMDEAYDELEEVNDSEFTKTRVRELLARVGNDLLGELMPSPDLRDWKVSR